MGHPVRFPPGDRTGRGVGNRSIAPTGAVAAAVPGGRRLTVSAQLLARLLGRPVPAGRTRR
jgi:hypothetical protein